MTAYSAALGFATLVALWVAYAAWKRRATPGALYLVLMEIAVAQWAFCILFESAATTMPLKLLWAQMAYPGTATGTVFSFLFIASHTQHTRLLSRSSRLLLFLIPLLTMLAAFTNPLHHALWTFNVIDPRTNTGVYGFGPVLWLFIVYTYVLVTVGMLLLLRSQLHFSPLHAMQARLMMLSGILPLLAGLLYSTGTDPLSRLELTPISFALTGVLLAVAIFRLRLLDIMPVARAQLIESMNDGVLVLDHDDCVVDVNHAAQYMLGGNAHALIGRAVGALLPHTPLPASLPADANFDLRHGGVLTFLDPAYPNDHHFIYVHVRILPLQNTHKRTIGWLLLLQDITAQRQIEHELSQANGRLQQQLAEIQALQAKLRADALQDELTGVYNRRHLMDVLQGCLERTGAHEEPPLPLSLVMLDLDHLKSINDTYGHGAGDLMLRELAGLLCRHARQGDVVCRVGGDEFVVVLPNTPASAAYQRAEVWRTAMEQMQVQYNGYTLCSTISQGVAAIEPGSTLRPSADALLTNADEALYVAKMGGRNCTMLWQSDLLMPTLQLPIAELIC
jgi:diguanylate cyclase (GGDEF)-like protein/PAS domain S-box-containing protein